MGEWAGASEPLEFDGASKDEAWGEGRMSIWAPGALAGLTCLGGRLSRGGRGLDLGRPCQAEKSGAVEA